MRELIKDPGRIAHMLEMARLVGIEETRHTLEELANDMVLFYGLSKMIEFIGEAAYMISKEFKESHTQLPWRQIEGMRPIPGPGFYSMSDTVLWDVVQNDIPKLIPVLEAYVDEMAKGSAQLG